VMVPPLITQQPPSLTLTQGTTEPFTVTAAGTAPLTFQWRLNGVNLAGATNSVLTLLNVQPAQAGNYQVVVANAAGSATSAVATLTVAGPPAILQQPTSLSVAPGAVATFSVTASGTPPLTFQWRFNGLDLVGAT